MSTGLDLAEATRLFDLYCRSKGLAERTVQTYMFALDGLTSYLSQGKHVTELPSTTDLRAYIAHMLERGLARGTIRIRMRSIRVFCNFLAREGIVPVSPFAGVEIPRVPERFPEALSAKEIQTLLSACTGKSFTAIRNAALMLTFLDTGARLGEVIRLNLEDVTLREQSIRIRQAKNGRERAVFMGRKLFLALRRWVEVRGLMLPSEALFCTRCGDRLKQRNVERIIERIANRAEIAAGKATPHRLRHTFATHFIANGGDPFSLQRILGHSDIKTTMIYVNMDAEGLRKAHAMASPVDRLLGSGRP